MKKTIMLMLLAVSVSALHAQNMRQLWIDMPDSLTTYLNKSLRTELADYVEMKAPAVVTNLLKEKTEIDTLTDNFMRIKLSAASEMEMKILPHVERGKVVALVRTYRGPVAQSMLSFYDMEWNPVAVDPVKWPSPESMIAKPEAMTEARYRDLLASVEMKLMEYHFSPADNLLRISLGIPLLTSDEKEDFQALLRQTNLNWDGKTFK